MIFINKFINDFMNESFNDSSEPTSNDIINKLFMSFNKPSLVVFKVGLFTR